MNSSIYVPFANGTPLARGKDQHPPGHALTFQGMPPFDHEARLGVNAAQKADGFW